MAKKKKLLFPMECDKCGSKPESNKQEGWEVINLNCKCGGRIVTDFSKPYYE